MLTYNERVEFDYSHYADVQLILYDDDICQKDTDADVVKVSHNGKRFPEYVKRVLNVLSRLVLPSLYYKESVL